MPPPSLPNILVMPGSPVPLSSPIVLVSPPPIPRCKVEVLEPLDRPTPHSRCPHCVKTPYIILSLSPLPPPVPVKRLPSPPLVVSPIIHCMPTISIPPRDTSIPVPPTLRKRARRKLLPPASPPAKKRCPANTSMFSYCLFISLLLTYSL